MQPHGHEAAALRTKGALRALVGFVAAGLLGWLGHPIVAAVAAGISLLTLVLAIVSPLGGYRLMQRGIATAGRGAGIFIGWLTLVPVFLLFFVPFGIVFRRGRKDPMRRNMSSTAPTYWRTRTADTDALERRKRLF
ncbi:MAG: hypothetical protein KC502_14080 [Myxococcales bacterium]|nr:hypothetical protein [Myxococcales bacterium]